MMETKDNIMKARQNGASTMVYSQATKQYKWDTRFLEMARTISKWSKDPKTKIGAVITNGKMFVSSGYNGFPHGITDNERLSLIQDPISGRSVVGFGSRLEKFIQYRLEPFRALIITKNIYRDVDSIDNFLKSRRQTLEDQTNEIDRNISIFSNAYRENLLASRDYGIELQLPTGTQTETQIGDGFLGQLLKLGDELSESTFRQYLLEEQIKLKFQKEEIITEIIKVKRQIFSQDFENGGIKSTSEYEPYEAIVKEFSSLIDDYGKVVGLVQKYVLSNNGALYESLNSTARVTNFDKIQLKRVIMAALVALILGGMVGTFITLLRKAGRSC